MLSAVDSQEAPPQCRRCHREAHGWPLNRGDRCSPRNWVHCIRDPYVVLAENAATANGEV